MDNAWIDGDGPWWPPSFVGGLITRARPHLGFAGGNNLALKALCLGTLEELAQVGDRRVRPAMRITGGALACGQMVDLVLF